MHQSLIPLGWDDHFQSVFKTAGSSDGFPARITGVHKNCFTAHTGKEERIATMSGRLGYAADRIYPVTGDFVLLKDTVITGVLPRKNELSRGAAGSRGRQGDAPVKAQVLAANIDTVFIVCGLDRDYNLRRIERYLTLAYNCGLRPVVVLTKADLHPCPDDCAEAVRAIAFGVPVHLVSALDNCCLAPIEPFIGPGQTITLVGSSGAGKSTLVNRLSGKTVQTVNHVSQHDGKGRHTTTTRSLIIMPQGGMVIDNPGIREIALWQEDAGAGSAFPDIDDLARSCRFSDCTHTHEPGCRVLMALETGKIEKIRLDNFRKMRREMDFLSQRQHKSADRLEKERWKPVGKKIKAMNKRKKGL